MHEPLATLLPKLTALLVRALNANVVEVSEEMLVLSEMHGGQRTPLLGVSELVLPQACGWSSVRDSHKSHGLVPIFQVEGLSNVAFLGTRSKRQPHPQSQWWLHRPQSFNT